MSCCWLQLASADFEAVVRARGRHTGPLEMVMADFCVNRATMGVYRCLKDTELGIIGEGNFSKDY